jgi:hypothetical protein
MLKEYPAQWISLLIPVTRTVGILGFRKITEYMFNTDSKYHCANTHLFTYLLSPWCRILFEKLIVTQPVKQ